MITVATSRARLLRCASALLTLTGISLLSCSSAGSSEESRAAASDDAFNQYWYSGRAELTRYALEQARYGEIRQGDAVLIFVTEDFLQDKQVKHEFGDAKDATSILKLNFMRKFYTGIYPYSIMTSIFTPVDPKSSTLKITSSSQEWCGHTFMQINARDNKLAVQIRSYFQAEGDQDFKMDSVFLEDEVWTRIRLAPNSLPTGDFRLLPGAQFLRLRHVPAKAERANATLAPHRDPALSEAELLRYTVAYQDIKRTLAITFEKDFPHRILAWEESHLSGFGAKAQVMTTKAVRTHSMLSDYWSRNKLSDSYLREQLGLIY